MIQSLGLIHQAQTAVPEEALPSGSSVEKEGKKDFALQQIPPEHVDIDPRSRIVVHNDPRGLAADRFRYLRMRLRELWSAGKVRKLLIASPLPQDGKSTVALNLATALSERGRSSVLLIEADLYRSPIAQLLGLKPGPGLAECLETGLDPLSALRHLEPLGWYLLPAGKPVGNPGDLLHGEVFPKIMKTISPHFDWVLVDSPPLMPITDALALAQQTDASLLVVRAGRTPRETVDSAITALGTKRVVGVVLNGVQGLGKLYSKYSGYHSYSSLAASTGRGDGPNR